jgi:hypothetical protein
VFVAFGFSFKIDCPNSMNIVRLHIAVAILSLPALPLFAGPNESEFLQLREKRDQALTTAAKPINEQYKLSLEDLLRRAVAAGDTETAPIIQFELQLLNADGTASLLPSTSKVEEEESALKMQLAGTKWRLSPDKTFELHADGTSTSNWTPRPGHWKVLGPDSLELSVWNVPQTEAVSVLQGGTLMIWKNKEGDQKHPTVAKKIVPEPAK